MKVFILDWNGTLDTLLNPLETIELIQSKGHMVVLWSTNCRDTDVKEQVDYYDNHKTDLSALVIEFGCPTAGTFFDDHGGKPTEIIVIDDMMDSTLRLQNWYSKRAGIPVRLLSPTALCGINALVQ